MPSRPWNEKDSRNCGKKHSQVKASTGKMVASAKPGPPCKCKKECYTKIMDDERKKIFSPFWGLGGKAVQDTYLHELIRVKRTGSVDCGSVSLRLLEQLTIYT